MVGGKSEACGDGATGNRLRITFVEAKGIRATNYFSRTSSDSFVEAFHVQGSGDCKFSAPLRSEVQFGSLDPKWDESFVFELSHTPHLDLVLLSVWGRHKVGSNDFIGRVEIPVTICIDDKTREDALKKNIRQYREGAVFDKWFKLLPQKGYNMRICPGEIRVRLQYIFAPLVSTTTTVKTTITSEGRTPPAVVSGKIRVDPVLFDQCPRSRFNCNDIPSHLSDCDGRVQASAPNPAAAVASSAQSSPDTPAHTSIRPVGAPATASSIPPPPNDYYGNAPSCEPTYSLGAPDSDSSPSTSSRSPGESPGHTSPSLPLPENVSAPPYYSPDFIHANEGTNANISSAPPSNGSPHPQSTAAAAGGMYPDPYLNQSHLPPSSSLPSSSASPNAPQDTSADDYDASSYYQYMAALSRAAPSYEE